MKSSSALTVVEAVVLLALVALCVMPFVCLIRSDDVDRARRAQAKNDAAAIDAATFAFAKEYKSWPGSGRGIVKGDLLAALTGSNAARNPRNLVFLEIEPATRGKSGLTNGIYVDLWGAPYQIAFAAGTNRTVQAGRDGREVKRQVAVWSEPALGRDAASLSPAKLARRYVTSWE